MTATLVNAEFAVHVFAPLTGPNRDGAYQHIHAVWANCASMLGMSEPIAGLAPLPARLPATPSDLPASSGPVAACHSGDGAFQALVLREHDTLCLSATFAPPGTVPAPGWLDLEGIWQGICGPVPPCVLGEARLFLTTRSDGCNHDSTDPPDLLTEVRTALSRGPDGDPSRWSAGVRTRSGFAVFEATTDEDSRALRRLVAVAPAGRDVQLSSWLWTSGDPVLAPFTRYLLHSAKARHQVRVWDQGQAFRAVRRRADETLDEMLPMIPGSRGTLPSTGPALHAWADRLDTLMADQAGLIAVAADLRAMRRTIQIAAANMTKAIASEVESARPDDHSAFADDRALVDWFDQQLDDDTEYLAATQDRVTFVASAIDRAMHRNHQQRRERVALLQTTVVGALVMVLTAAQAFSYQLPLSPTLKPALIAVLVAVTVYPSLLAIRLTSPTRRGLVSWYELAALGLVAASGTWVVVASLWSWVTTWRIATFAMLGFAATWLVGHLIRGRGRSG